MPPKLRDVIKKCLEAEGMNQAKLAEKLYGSTARQGRVSSLARVGDEDSREKHWQVCAKLVPLAINLGALTERELLDLPIHDKAKRDGHSKAGGTKTNQNV